MDVEENDDLYGILAEKNIKFVQLGLFKKFETWYGTAVYFNSENKKLGFYDETQMKPGQQGNGYGRGSKIVKGKTVKKKKMTNKALSSLNDHALSNIQLKSNPKTSDNQFWLDTLYVCEYCFKYTDVKDDFVNHVHQCSFKEKAPGGSNIKLDHYEFYIVYETGKTIPMAFFSKDLVSYNQNNLACILTLPPYQRMGLGSLLIEFSYHLSRLEGIVSGPELPLSPFGLIGYLRYWSLVICWQLCEGDLSNFERLSIQDISLATGIRISDIIPTLNHLNCIIDENHINLKVLKQWLKLHTKPGQNPFMINEEYLLIDD
ncbi:related to Histone acetyltransferase SAS2 [Nakaseomyces glabratus]|nr:related to Histone acetyltransferase SAS2 [Nakaseomyces glabratus]SLM16761.1 related to Histone acetyltransferase SAS2 [Nakaseomyces glabratus]